MTELIWDGKYKDGKKQGPVRIALPFQTIETVNESAQAAGGILSFLPAGAIRSGATGSSGETENTSCRLYCLSSRAR